MRKSELVDRVTNTLADTGMRAHQGPPVPKDQTSGSKTKRVKMVIYQVFLNLNPVSIRSPTKSCTDI